MFVSDLYERVLMAPLRAKEAPSDELFIVSGYASATFLQRHLSEAKTVNPNMKLHLIIGMKQNRSDHPAYLRLASAFPNSFFGYYYDQRPEVHAKTYCWYGNGAPVSGFTGSANYSQQAFFADKQRNQMTEDDPSKIKDFFDLLLPSCTLMGDYKPAPAEIKPTIDYDGDVVPGGIIWVNPNQSVRISLLSRDGSLAGSSGLNWGFRANGQKRDLNEAYLSIRTDANKEGFLPDKKFTFTLVTDDNMTMDCTVQQDGRKAVSTTTNSELGLYFRRRLNLPPDTKVLKKHLLDYGRTDFLLSKLNEETFYLDFSKPKIESV